MVAPQHAHAPRPPRSASPGWGRPGAGGSGGGESRSDVSVAAEGGAVLGVGSALAAACLPRQGMKHGLGSMSPPASAPILFS